MAAMRRSVLVSGIVLLGAALCVSARPDKLEPLPDISPPDVGTAPDKDVPPPAQEGPGVRRIISPDSGYEPEITIVQRKEEQVEEYRVRGHLYKMKVTPKHGKPYWLVDDRGDGQFIRFDNLDTGIRVPLWVILKF